MTSEYKDMDAANVKNLRMYHAEPETKKKSSTMLEKKRYDRESKIKEILQKMGK